MIDGNTFKRYEEIYNYSTTHTAVEVAVKFDISKGRVYDILKLYKRYKKFYNNPTDDGPLALFKFLKENSFVIVSSSSRSVKFGSFCNFCLIMLYSFSNFKGLKKSLTSSKRLVSATIFNKIELKSTEKAVLFLIHFFMYPIQCSAIMFFCSSFAYT